MLTEKEIDIIKASSEWDEEGQTYKVPLFNFKNKKIAFPKMNNAVGKFIYIIFFYIFLSFRYDQLRKRGARFGFRL